MNKFYYGVDVGGTNIKAGLVNEDNQVEDFIEISTNQLLNENTLAKAIFMIVSKLSEKNNVKINDCLGIGIGFPGNIQINNQKVSAFNLNIFDYDLLEELKTLVSVPIKIANDADIATLAEQKLGAGKDCDNFIMLTLGTGIGGGIVYKGENLGIKYGLPFEIGHIKVQGNMRKCNCGEFGCFETIASTKALICSLKNALNENPTSAIWKKYNISNIEGKTIFEFPKDYVAKETLKQYIKNVGQGIISLVNIFKPDLVVIGGAISVQKENLIAPIEKYVNSHNFFKNTNYKLKIVSASFLEKSGVVGAKLLFN